MTEQVQTEEVANPYNSNKDYMDGKEDKPFVSSNSIFFDETSLDTSNVEEMSVEEEVQSEDKPYQRPDYKKRYDDLKRHYDSKLNEFKAREQELLDEAIKNRPDYVAPKTPEELEEFKKEYPDVFEVVETVAHMQSSEKAKVLEEQLSTLQAREKETLQRQALARKNKIVSQLDLSFSKYKAACWLNYLWNKQEIDGKVLDYYEGDNNAA